MLPILIAASISLQSTDIPLPAQPSYGHYVADAAGMLDVYSEHVIDSIGELRYAEGRPLYVVTIDSVPGDSNERYWLVTYAKAIYDDWKIGANVPANRGTLVLLAKGNRQAIIMFGSGWGGLHDADGVRLTRDVFNPALASDAPGDAIVAGVRTLSGALSAPNAGWRRQLAWIPMFAMVLAWLSVARIKRRNARRAAASEALLATLALQLTGRQYGSLRAAEENAQRRISPSAPPS